MQLRIGACIVLVFSKQDSFHATFTPWRQWHGGHQKMSNLRKAGKDQKTWVMKINDGLSKSVLEKYPKKKKAKTKKNNANAPNCHCKIEMS